MTDDLLTVCANVRRRVLSLGPQSVGRTAHYGGALSCVEILVAGYSFYLRLSADDRNNERRDRFVLSKGHACLALYATLIELGLLDETDVGYEINGSPFAGHPVISRDHLLDFSTGSLGNGFAYALGAALADKDRRVLAVIGDGELGEGIIWECFRVAVQHNLSNLVAVIDVNKLQQTGTTNQINGNIDLPAALAAFGWRVFAGNGHDIDFLVSTFKAVIAEKSSGSPSILICETIKGLGMGDLEGLVESHHAAI